MYKTFLQIWIFILCINGMLIVANSLVDESNTLSGNDMAIGTPFDITTDLDPCSDPTNDNCIHQ